MSDSLRPHGLQQARLSCPSPTPELLSTDSVMPSNHLILCCYLSSYLQSCPASGSSPISQFFTSVGQSIGASASASVLPMNIQDWFPLGLMLGSLCCPRDSQESYPTPQFKTMKSSTLSFLYGPFLTSIHDYQKNHSLDYMDLCQQSNISAF